MHYLRDYAQAVAHEASVKPLRTTNIKPYGLRREGRWFNISKDADESIVVCLYDEPLVRFQPDGTIIVSTPWYSWAVSERLQQVLGASVQQKHNKLWVHTAAGWTPVPPRKDGVLLLRRTPEDSLQPAEPVAITRHRVNRKAKNAVMARYKSFIDYLHVVVSMGGDAGYTQKHLVAVLGEKNAVGYSGRKRVAVIEQPNAYETAREVVALMRDNTTPDAWSRAAMNIIAHRGYGMLIPTTGPADTCRTIVDKTEVDKHLVDILLYAHRDEVFVKYADTSGKAVKDEYAKFFV